MPASVTPIASTTATQPSGIASIAARVEIGETQGDTVTALARAAGFADVEVKSDLAGKPRVLVARRCGDRQA
jgi:methylase of polypeptide subunit release factors